MKNSLPFIIAVLFTIIQGTPAVAQLGPVDIDSVRALVSDPKGAYHYPRLLQRFTELDTTLNDLEYRLIYYGFAFQDDYLKNQPDETGLQELTRGEDYAAMKKEAAAILKLNPVSLMANNVMGYALFKTEPEKEEWKRYRTRHRALRRTIAMSGDGLSSRTAFVVLYVEDEYEMMYSYFEIPKIHRQRCCDVFEVDEGRYFKAPQIYFDVSLCLMRRQRLLEGKE